MFMLVPPPWAGRRAGCESARCSCAVLQWTRASSTEARLVPTLSLAYFSSFLLFMIFQPRLYWRHRQAEARPSAAMPPTLSLSAVARCLLLPLHRHAVLTLMHPLPAPSCCLLRRTWLLPLHKVGITLTPWHNRIDAALGLLLSQPPQPGLVSCIRDVLRIAAGAPGIPGALWLSMVASWNGLCTRPATGLKLQGCTAVRAMLPLRPRLCLRCRQRVASPSACTTHAGTRGATMLLWTVLGAAAGRGVCLPYLLALFLICWACTSPALSSA